MSQTSQSNAESQLRMMLNEFSDTFMYEFLALVIDSSESIDQPQSQGEESSFQLEDIYFDVDGRPYTEFMGKAITFGILWEREDNPPRSSQRFNSPFGQSSLSEFISHREVPIQSAMNEALSYYERTGGIPKADVFHDQFPSEWERNAFAVGILFGCLLQGVGKKNLQNFSP